MNNKKIWMLAAAVAALPLFGARSAQAQYLVDNGHANDANNRVGSGGDNGDARKGPLVTNSDIVYGNVTGGRQFRGKTFDVDPRGFHGPTFGGTFDSFVRDSSAAPAPFQPIPDLTTPRAFYGDSRKVPPPLGTVREGFTGSYVSTGLQPLRGNDYLTDPLILQQDLRLGSAFDLGVSRLPLAGNGRTNLQEQSTDVQTDNPTASVIASPLYGLQRDTLNQQNDALFQSTGIQNQNTQNQKNPNGSRLNPDDVQRMQRELQNSDQAQDDNNPDQSSQPRGQQPLNGRTQQPFESPANARLSARPLNASVGGEAIGTAGAGTGQTVRQQLLVPPARQSSQYAELERRLQRYQPNGVQTDEQANREFNRQRQLVAAQAAKTGGQETGKPPGQSPKGTGPLAGGTGAGPLRAGSTPPGAQPQEGAEPLKVSSLATGVKAKGLHDLLTSAEDQMRQGQFDTAFQTYAAAQRVAPNNPLIALGRVHAELGAAYYARAEADLRRLIASDPELLLGQYDLNGMMKAERVQFLTKDLQEIAKSDPKQARPWLLLAYIAYNTGDARQAASYLDEAQKRSGQLDMTIQSMRAHWALPKDKPAAPENLNK